VSFLLSPVLFPVAINNHVLSFFFGPCYFTLLMSTFHVRYHCFSTWVALIFFASGYVNYLCLPLSLHPVYYLFLFPDWVVRLTAH
jgi:hypothetical protein